MSANRTCKYMLAIHHISKLYLVIFMEEETRFRIYELLNEIYKTLISIEEVDLALVHRTFITPSSWEIADNYKTVGIHDKIHCLMHNAKLLAFNRTSSREDTLNRLTSTFNELCLDLNINYDVNFRK